MRLWSTAAAPEVGQTTLPRLVNFSSDISALPYLSDLPICFGKFAGETRGEYFL